MTDCNASFSICIPCYNDLEGLRQTIRSILEQGDIDQADQFQIVIGLNDCSFEEREVLKEQDLNSKILIKAFKTSEYLEYDDSIQFILSHVETEFCLLLGCGELALENFMEALISFENCKKDFGLLPVRLKRQGDNSKRFSLESAWCPAPLGIFNKILSGHLFRTVSLKMMLKDHPVIAPVWAHIEIALIVQGHSEFGSMIYGTPVILRLDTQNGWWSKADIYKQYIEYCDLLLEYGNRYPKLEYVKEELSKAYSVRLLLMILQVRANGMREVPLFFSAWVCKYCRGNVQRFIMKSALWIPEKFAAKLMNLANWWLERKQQKLR